MGYIEQNWKSLAGIVCLEWSTVGAVGPTIHGCCKRPCTRQHPSVREEDGCNPKTREQQSGFIPDTISNYCFLGDGRESMHTWEAFITLRSVHRHVCGGHRLNKQV